MDKRTSISSGPYDSVHGQSPSFAMPRVSLDTQGGRHHLHHHHQHPSHRRFMGSPKAHLNHGFSGDVDQEKGYPNGDLHRNPLFHFPGFGGNGNQKRESPKGGLQRFLPAHNPGGNRERGGISPNGGPKRNLPNHNPSGYPDRGRLSPNGGPKRNLTNLNPRGYPDQGIIPKGDPQRNHPDHYPGGYPDRGRVRSNGGPSVNPPVHYPGYSLHIANDPTDHPSWEPSDGSLLYPSSNPSSGYPALPEPDYLSVNGPSINSKMDERLGRKFGPFPPPIPERPERTTPQESRADKSAESVSTSTGELGTRKTRGRCLIVIVAAIIIIVVGTAAGISVPLILEGDSDKNVQGSTVSSGPTHFTTSALASSTTTSLPIARALSVVAYLKEATRLSFELPYNVTVNDNITIFNGDVIVATFNVTGNETLFTHPRMLVSVERSGDSASRVSVTFMKTECGDGGQFVVASAAGEDETERSAPVSVNLRSRPTPPTLRVPEQIAETHTTDNPVCSVTSLDHPRVVFSWAIRWADGNSTVFPPVRQNDVIVTNETSCESSGNSTFFADGYENWNNSDICCQLRDAGSDELYFETCRHLQTLPADYCESGENLKIYPFETCYTFVDCQIQGQVHFKKCTHGLCIDVEREQCSSPPPPSQPAPSPPIPDPYNCDNNTSPYLPLSNTYPDQCQSFQRCSGGRAVQDSCQHGQEYTFQSSGSGSDIVCSLPADDTYCGRKFLEEDPLVKPMGDRIGRIGQSVSFHCVVTRLTKLRTISFLRESSGAQVATLDDMTLTFARHDVAVTWEERGEGRGREVEVVLTFTNVTCADGGNYVCVAGGGGKQVRQSAELQTTREPEPPTLEVPELIVEKRTTQNPVCKAGSLGFEPNLGFGWVLRRPGGSVDNFPDNRKSNLIYTQNCNAFGNSTLKAQRYVTWGGSDLCCQLRNSSDVTVYESCKLITVVPPVELPGSPVAPINQPFSLQCLMRSVSSDVQVEFFHDSQLVASFNNSNSSGIVQRSRLTVEGAMQGDLFVALLNFSQISCSDKGNYSCRAVDPNDVDENGDPFITETSTVLKIHRPPGDIDLKMVCAAEGITYAKPNCTVSSSGYNPALDLTWTLMFPDGINHTRPALSYNFRMDETTCDSSINSLVDTNLYRGWNNTHLCCQLRHPDTHEVVKEVCKYQTVIPGDYCGDGSQRYKHHPYDHCSKYVQCENNVVYCSHCNPGLCIDINSEMCL